MKKLLIVLSLSLCFATAFPQRESFFNVYEQAEKSFCASAAIETDDGCFIIAVYDYYGGCGEFPRFLVGRSLFTSEGDFLYATTLRPEQDYHRLYMRIALDGTLTTFHEETEDCGTGIMINAIFEFPEGNRFGEYRNSHRVPGDIALWPRLFSFDDDFVFDTLHEYGNILQTLGDTVHSILHDAAGNGTVRVFNDSILLFSAKVYEDWHIGLTTYETDQSTLFFSSDLEGNIKNYLVIGSKNNSTEVPIAFNAIH